MTVLVPMRPEVYDAYLAAAVAGYAEDNIGSGRWSAADALARSRAEFESLLPQGLATPDNYLYEIMDSAGGPTVGFIWFAVFGHNAGAQALYAKLGYRVTGINMVKSWPAPTP